MTTIADRLKAADAALEARRKEDEETERSIVSLHTILDAAGVEPGTPAERVARLHARLVEARQELEMQRDIAPRYALTYAACQKALNFWDRYVDRTNPAEAWASSVLQALREAVEDGASVEHLAANGAIFEGDARATLPDGERWIREAAADKQISEALMTANTYAQELVARRAEVERLRLELAEVRQAARVWEERAREAEARVDKPWLNER